jgi:hypothetical protein
MKRIMLMSLVKDIETLAPKAFVLKETEEEEKLSHRVIEVEVPQVRRGAPGKRRRAKK